MLVQKQDEVYYTYEPFNNTVKTHIILDQSGTMHRRVWNWKTTEWSILYTWPFDSCDHYAQCGFSWGQDIFLRVPASELVQHYSNKKKKIKIIAVVSTIIGIFILVLVLCTVWKKTKNRGLESKEEEEEVPLVDLSTIAAATNNFSQANMIGKGGFGPVYKGNLSTGQEIAVKRLSNNSGQGVEEFKSEVVLIGKLQHKNLVSLLGCCIQGDERMLIYEYMPNKSLDYFIFDDERSKFLSWRKRIFKGDDKEANTKRIAGTYGYMSPEYATDGNFSLKSDVFSFGVLLLEIISGKKNRGFCHPDHHLNLLGHAWVLWNNGRPEMSSVVFMLANEGLLLPQPKQPGFFTERGFIPGSTSLSKEKSHTENALSITTLDGR
ncbi:hypothetical protein Q3G72_018884 [Acer saccharum]|nr:hypothetical protein Q3G72_018884 [Acer saccharum]